MIRLDLLLAKSDDDADEAGPGQQADSNLN